METMVQADFEVSRLDIYFRLLTPRTPAATAWVEEHVQDPMWWGQGVVVERAFLEALVDGIEADGLSVENS